MATISPSPERKVFPIVSPNGNRGERGNATSTPNQHPYAIKTTSTALLTRSNSSGFAIPHQHVYIPSSPSPSKHRHSKSDLSQSSPRPLPIPPSLESPTKVRKGHGYAASEEFVFPSLRARADTLPNSSELSLPAPVKLDDLPSNPRVWTTSQLASYLITALRVKSGEVLPLPLPVAKDIAAFVKEARLNGRAFLRLNEQDLESMGINNLWREALLNASRNLRQNVLKGRIWGFDAEDPVETSRILPFRSSYNSSSSSIDQAFGSQESTPHKSGDRKGRVRGLIASLERTSSSGSGFSNHGSSTSEGEVIHWADDEAAFASGSEASEVEDRKARPVTKKPLLPEIISKPTNSFMEDQEIVKVSSPDEEPSVEELLTSGSMSGSWGAKAWEDMNIGETVKHIGTEHEIGRGGVSGDFEDASGSNSGKCSHNRKGDARKQIGDVFTRPLPSRPLPPPPKSEISSPLITASPMHIVTRVDRSIQVNAELSQSAEGENKVQSPEAADDSERLQQALSLLEQYRERLAELEEKLNLLERKDTEQEHVEHISQGSETDAEPVFVSAPVSIDVFAPESKSLMLGHSHAAGDEHPTSGSDRLQTTAGPSRCPPLSPSGVEDTDHSAYPDSSVGPEWRKHFDNHEWDPAESGITSYVLMVGVGVCAVVLSTILKRLANKKS